MSSLDERRRRPSIPHSALALGTLTCCALFSAGLNQAQAQTAPSQPSPPPASKARTASPYIGSVMALLAAFSDAGVLPPEGTAQANRIIKAAIQFQSAFLKSRHPAVRQLFSDAHRATFGDRAEDVAAVFQQRGWTAETVNAIMQAGRQSSTWGTTELETGLREFNIDPADFDLLAQLYQDSASAFAARGTTFHDVYVQRRSEMPGAATNRPRHDSPEEAPWRQKRTF